jgi:exosome complex component RRP41
MGSKVEFVDMCGLRQDGRRPAEARKVVAKLGVLPSATGSALLEQGLTQVVATVHGPRECSLRSLEQHDRAIVTCRVAMAPFAAAQQDRKVRHRTDAALAEVANLVKQTLEAVIFAELHPRSQIDIGLEVLQGDGPVRTACINAATLALIDAGVAIRDFLCAASVTYASRPATFELLLGSASAPPPPSAYPKTESFPRPPWSPGASRTSLFPATPPSERCSPRPLSAAPPAQMY